MKITCAKCGIGFSVIDVWIDDAGDKVVAFIDFFCDKIIELRDKPKPATAGKGGK